MCYVTKFKKNTLLHSTAVIFLKSCKLENLTEEHNIHLRCAGLARTSLKED